MNRRWFVLLLGQATVGATVAYSLPSIIVPRNIQPVRLPYIVSNTARNTAGMITSTYRDLNAPSLELSGAILTPEMFEHTRMHLYTMVRMRSENPMLSFR